MTQTIFFGRNATAGASETSRPSQATPSLWQRVASLFRRNNDRLQTIRELHGLSDEMLRDIGIDRDDIEQSVGALLAGSRLDTNRIPR
jgi:uncharacterized protein YjiS (DUF1127 family)